MQPAPTRSSHQSTRHHQPTQTISCGAGRSAGGTEYQGYYERRTRTKASARYIYILIMPGRGKKYQVSAASIPQGVSLLRIRWGTITGGFSSDKYYVCYVLLIIRGCVKCTDCIPYLYI